jgi:hypothetical protein
MHPTLSPLMASDHMYVMRSMHSNLSPAIHRAGQSYYSREKRIPNYIPSTPADRFASPHLVFLLLSTKEEVEKAKHMLAVGY